MQGWFLQLVKVVLVCPWLWLTSLMCVIPTPPPTFISCCTEQIDFEEYSTFSKKKKHDVRGAVFLASNPKTPAYSFSGKWNEKVCCAGSEEDGDERVSAHLNQTTVHRLPSHSLYAKKPMKCCGRM